MKTRVLSSVLFIILFNTVIFSNLPLTYEVSDHFQAAANNIFFQTGNFNTVVRNDGYFNYDKITFTSGAAGFIWPSASAQRLTAIFTTGIMIGARYVIAPNQKETRVSASFYNTHYSPGNIPVIGQIPPQSVCNDPAFNGYLVSVTDQSLVNGGTRTKTAAGRIYTFNYSSWSAWPVSQGAPYVEVNGVPGYQPGWNADRPGTGYGNARPSEMIFTVFMDYTNCTGNVHQQESSLPGGSLPLGVEIQQLVYAFDVDGLKDSYFVRYKIINKSGKTWDSTYISLANDADVGDASDDAVGCDSLKNIAYTYNFDNQDADYGSAPPAVGYRLLQGPLVFTGINTDTVKLPCNTLIGYKMRLMHGHNYFVNGGDSCNGDPDNFRTAYNFMKGLNGCGVPIINPVSGLPTKFVYSGNACNSTGWNDNGPGDKRNLLNCGPFNMNSGDTQVVVYSFNIARSSNNRLSVCALIEQSENIKSYYYDCFNLIGIQPVKNSIPAKFDLSQNYPNPFNPETNIKFDIPVSSFVKLSVYNALGQKINQLINEKLEAGTYNAAWNASDYPSGIYYYTLETESYIVTKKMVLIK